MEKVFRITGVLVFLIVLGMTADFSHKQYVNKISEIEKYNSNRKEAYMKFEELYRSVETELNEVVEELKSEGLYELNSSKYVVCFEENAIKRPDNSEFLLCYFDGAELKGRLKESFKQSKQ